MKLKKFFAGVLAAAMMLTVGATAAFATEGSNTKPTVDRSQMIVADGNDVANFTLTKKLVVAKGTAPQKMTFNFTVGDGQADTAKKIKAGIVPTNFTQPSVTFSKTGNDKFTVSTDNSAYSNTFNIDLVKLLGGNSNKVGKYAYTISEDDTKIPGITKDNRTLKMVVTVVNKTDDNLGPDTGYGYYVGLFNQDGSKADDFTNTYNAYDLTVKKVVKGNFADLDDSFTFNITLSKDANKEDNYAGATVTVSDNTNPAHNASWAIDGTARTITLKHNQTAIISNLPVGVTYTVTETQGEGWVYDTDGEVKTATAINAEKNEVTIINDHQGTPDMGVVLDNAPYIAMLAIVAIGGVALMLNKRRRDEE